ncbi:MAG: hypothetical protein ABJA98_01510 [Acidobacteriota bacterium]
MTLDDLIETLQALRAQYPGAGTAVVDCPVEIEPSYELGEVQLGFVFVVDDDEDDDDEPTRVH